MRNKIGTEAYTQSSFSRLRLPDDSFAYPAAAVESNTCLDTSQAAMNPSNYPCDASKKIFVGTWNVRFQEFPKGFILSGRSKSKILRREHSVDLPCIYTDSEIAPNNESLSSSNTSDSSTTGKLSSRRLPLPKMHDKMHVRRSTLLLQPPAGTEQPLKDWIVPNYDIYVISFQETLSSRLSQTISSYLNIEHKKSYKRLDLANLKISGHGDGAFLSVKSTSLAVWVREELLFPVGSVKLLGSAKISLGFLKGSKGAVSVVLEIDDQRICFIGCHFPASNKEERRMACEMTLKRFAYSYSRIKNTIYRHTSFLELFSVNLLSQKNIGELLSYDEFSLENHKEISSLVFYEPPIEFLPTYKKLDGRSPLNCYDAEWIQKEYDTKASMKWYKGIAIEKRIPAWTDRVIKWSHARVEDCLRYCPNTYTAALPKYQNLLIASDHTPVGCGYTFHPLPENISIELKKLPIISCDSDS
ncbi:endonuclease/exonuclease/phosphatase family protein [Cardiosporidium cionae]|uniref:Endonuclease/exonuclease/phosphatase family protein n=1 Tax=Cardiosporidium cionae TaxID=476202 RepID=A0ABQ7JB86_9APIC|nr:endonuclease/exonuclease/phosphatase family protein [Cardiosporidium cionae]|eukprot:KAF8821262.1 endonuclease/exonuclease/phosphatase family protein [Cardiosporidium cionae]